jgi:two-component system chemotaxis response regulator CheB
MARLICKKTIPAGNRIRVLVVDDSVVIRRLVTQALSEDPMLEVVGSVSNGVLGLAKIAQANPDVVTLDVEMPEMDGLEMLRRMGSEHRPRVVMFSTLTERGAAATMDALALGADDYVTKAANGGSLDRSLNSLREELIPKVKQFFVLPQQGPAQPQPRPATASATRPAFPRPMGGHAKILAIGVSTGGTTALGAIIPQVPADFPLPILIVQHMPPLFTRLLAERLQASTRLKVEEAVEGSAVIAGTVLIAPGDYHMRVRINGKNTAVIALDQAPPENSCRPAVDVLFRSVGETFGGSAIGAILTGMGQDGLRGAQTLKATGAFVIAQDEASSVVWGMPGSVVNAGLADSVVPLDRVIPEILRRI